MNGFESVPRREPGRAKSAPAMAAVLGVALSFVADAQPSAPKGFSATPGDAEAILSWADPSDDAITGYSVRHAASEAELSSESAPAWTAIAGSDAATVKHTVPGLANGERHHFQVRAVGADGAGPPSNVATTRLAASPSAVVAINDGALRKALERHLGATAGAEITQLDIATLGSLRADDFGISDLAGLEHAVNLTWLSLSDNAISDISALGSLESLTWLQLQDNSISDVSALGSLESLEELGLGGNAISDVSALGSLESLRTLRLRNNAISNFSALDSFESLESLDLRNNAISNFSALGSLESLTWLQLQDNSISNFSALGSLESLTRLDLRNNAISDVSALGSLESLTWLDLRNNAISGVSALGSLESLTWLDLSNNAISDVSALIGIGTHLGRLAVVGLRGNPLSADAIERHVPALRAAGAGVVAGWPVPFFPSAEDPSGRQGFVRVVNRSDVGGEVLIDAADDAGARRGPVRLAIGAGEAAHFNSDDLEAGNAAKGFPEGVGAPTAGSWRLTLSSTLDIEVLSYVRAPDGFLTSMHDMLPREVADWRVAIFNPGSNQAQWSSLRLANPGRVAANVSEHSVGESSFSMSCGYVPAGGVSTFSVAEKGEMGKRRWTIAMSWPVEAVGLLTSPGGHVTNISTAPAAGADNVWRTPLFPAADGASGREGVVRVVNHSRRAGEVAVVAVDDGGARAGPVALALKAGRTVRFNSGDLERGNAAKGLPVGVGPPARGDWRLELASELDIAVTSHVRTADGFLTSMHDLAPPGVAAQTARVAFFNPGSNRRQASLLRVMNDGAAAATVTVTGVDDAGTPGGEVRLTVPAGEALTWESAALEAGGAAFEGALGDGAGKWRLAVSSDVPVSVMSLLRGSSGHLTNLSSVTRP